MDESEIQQIFTPFSKSHNLRRQLQHQLGTGVGLSICKQICQKLEGDITVKSLKGFGSEFKFTMQVFPLNTEPSSIYSPIGRTIIADLIEEENNSLRGEASCVEECKN